LLFVGTLHAYESAWWNAFSIRYLERARYVQILGLAAGSAQAAFINGSISFADFGLTLPGIPSTSIVSQLTAITQGVPTVGNCTGNFSTAPVACDLAGAPTAASFNTAGPFGGTIYTYGGFTFTLLSVTSIDRSDVLHVNPNGSLGDTLSFTVSGIVDDGAGGLDATAFSGEWTAQGSCSGVAGPPVTCTATPTGSWSASLTALGRRDVPEPTSLALIGIAIAGMGLSRRRKQS
jgi:hypothetical protein